MAEEKRVTKTQLVTDHLIKYGTIDTWTAIDKYRATRLSSIIFNLKKKGYYIVSKDKKGKDSYGNTSTWTEYKLIKAPDI